VRVCGLLCAANVWMSLMLSKEGGHQATTSCMLRHTVTGVVLAVAPPPGRPRGISLPGRFMKRPADQKGLTCSHVPPCASLPLPLILPPPLHLHLHRPGGPAARRPVLAAGVSLLGTAVHVQCRHRWPRSHNYHGHGAANGLPNQRASHGRAPGHGVGFEH